MENEMKAKAMERAGELASTQVPLGCTCGQPGVMGVMHRSSEPCQAITGPEERVPRGEYKAVGWLWKMHGWTITAHGKHRSINTSISISPPPSTMKESLDFVSLERVFVQSKAAATQPASHVVVGRLTDDRIMEIASAHFERPLTEEEIEAGRPGFLAAVHAILAATTAPAVDAQSVLYATLRAMHWHDGKLAVIDAKDLPLGVQTYSGNMLDQAIMAMQTTEGGA